MSQRDTKIRLDEMRDKLITIALATTGGNRTKAAKMMGMSVRSLHRRIAERRLRT